MQIKFLALCIFMVFSTASKAEVVVLLCKAVRQGQQLVRSFKVDYDRRSVDGLPASFSESEILWTTAAIETDRVVYLDHHLHRLAGTYYLTSRGAVGIPIGPPTSFACEKAPAAKF